MREADRASGKACMSLRNYEVVKMPFDSRNGWSDGPKKVGSSWGSRGRLTNKQRKANLREDEARKAAERKNRHRGSWSEIEHKRKRAEAAEIRALMSKRGGGMSRKEAHAAVGKNMKRTNSLLDCE